MAKRMSPLLTVLISFLLISLVSILLVTFIPDVKEMFYGAQGGELVQLASSHVPTAEDLVEEQEEQEQIKRDLINLTGSY
jgi:hypothetical protein